ncbi:hypothetical protein [Alteromonas oceanisediminis]|uniref:hypothetical protein n=1 Tax=Alteromonas oceanisediminis TaxID=2836180 RepID=UPI001BD9EAE2|nr:hypothetical protein [Alteromonas oceanisediminis]MBT0587590.1 hypothetical protein [Alteromonas oceanisediminis]
MQQLFLALLATAILFITASYVSSVIFVATKTRLSAASPAARCLWLLGLSLTPVIITVISAVSLVFPEQVNLFSHITHCHGESCSPHVPAELAHSAWGTAMVVTLLAATAVPFLLINGYVYRTEKRLATLSALSSDKNKSPQFRWPYSVLEHSTPTVFSAGWLRPRIFVSTAALSQFDSAELTKKLAYEHASMVYHDREQKRAIHELSRAWPSMARQRLKRVFAEAVHERQRHAAKRLLQQTGNDAGQDGLSSKVPTQSTQYVIIALLAIYTWAMSVTLTSALHWFVEGM